MTSPLQLAIIGDGLAANLLAYYAAQHISPADIATINAPALKRGSDVPGALMHPFPGRSLEPTDDLLHAYQTSLHTLSALQASDPTGQSPWLRQQRMWRPLMPGKLGKRYLNTYQRRPHELPSTLEHTLLDNAQLTAQQPDLSHFEQAIVYGPTLVVSIPGLLHRLQHDPALNIQRINGPALALTWRTNHWRISLPAGQHLDAQRVVIANGIYLKRWFPQLLLTVNGGELLLAAANSRFDESISAGGHLGTMPDGSWVLGSTYLHLTDEHDPESPTPPRTDDLARSELQALISRQLPSVAALEAPTVWRGRRAVSQPDRDPIAGPIPNQENLFILGALGSKGLLWAPSLAQSLAADILAPHTPHHAIPERASSARIDAAHWQLNP